jgi:hypothetical protein
LTAGRGKEGGEAAGRDGDRAVARARGGAAGGRRKERGKGEADRRAPVVSAAGEKRKREEERSGPAREAGWAAWAEREPALVFFLFLFQTSFSNHYSIQIQIKPFKLFLKNFINFLETSQATKNHASQLMMHKHLLSLSYLNYI